MFKGIGMRVAARRASGAALMAVLLASCGGGEQVVKFAPTRIISFGDESSLIVDAGDHNGTKYTVNALKTGTAVLDCAVNPVWNQYLGQAFGLVFPQCNSAAVAAPSRIFAANGAKVADVAAQINAFKATDTFNGTTLVTILVGQNDVIEQFEAVSAGITTAAQAQANVEQAGVAVAGLVNDIGALGGKTIISTIYDVATTPYGIARELAHPGDAALLTLLTKSFNSKLRISLVNDGKMTGLVLTDEAVSSAVKNPGITFVDVTTPVCVAALPNCTTDTLITTPAGATGDTYLWADDRHLSSGGQRAVGAIAATRATGNPF